MVDRSDEPLLQICAENGIAWVQYFPLGGGYGTLPKVVDQKAVQAVASRLGATPSQVGLAWQLAHSPNTMLISGTSSIEHLRENTAAGDLGLDEAAMTSSIPSISLQNTPDTTPWMQGNLARPTEVEARG